MEGGLDGGYMLVVQSPNDPSAHHRPVIYDMVHRGRSYLRHPSPNHMYRGVAIRVWEGSQAPGTEKNSSCISVIEIKPNQVRRVDRSGASRGSVANHVIPKK